MKTLLVGAAGAFILSALLVSGYLWLARDNLIILSLDRGALVENGVMMAMVCGDGSGKELLDKAPPDGNVGPWTKGRTVRGDCDIWYHHTERYSRCGTSEVIFDDPRPCQKPSEARYTAVPTWPSDTASDRARRSS
jgi:hypothetical protein